MRSRQPSTEHQDALNRRLALLGEELAWLRPDAVEPLPPGAPRPGAAGERADHGDGHGGGPAGGPGRPWWDDHTRVSGRASEPGTLLGPAGTDPHVTVTGAGSFVGPPDDGTVPPAPTAVGARSGSGPVRIALAGRHAARGPLADGAGVHEREPGDLRWPGRSGSVLDTAAARVRVLLGPAQLTVVTIVVVLALGVTCWWLARGRPESTVALQAAPAAGLTQAPDDGMAGTTGAAPDATVAAVAATSTTPGAGPLGTPTAGPSAAAATVTVDVSGRVRHPGVQVLAAGARVADALAAAGGARPGVDLTSLNLAQVLADGQQVLVGVATDAGTSSVSGGSGTVGAASGSGMTTSAAGSAAGATQVVDLNSATAEQLDSLPDVGPVTAQSILAWRDAHGGFSSVDELLEVDGIGEVTLGKLAPFVTV